MIVGIVALGDRTGRATAYDSPRAARAHARRPYRVLVIIPSSVHWQALLAIAENDPVALVGIGTAGRDELEGVPRLGGQRRRGDVGNSIADRLRGRDSDRKEECQRDARGNPTSVRRHAAKCSAERRYVR